MSIKDLCIGYHACRIVLMTWDVTKAFLTFRNHCRLAFASLSKAAISRGRIARVTQKKCLIVFQEKKHPIQVPCYGMYFLVKVRVFSYFTPKLLIRPRSAKNNRFQDFPKSYFLRKYLPKSYSTEIHIYCTCY